MVEYEKQNNDTHTYTNPKQFQCPPGTKLILIHTHTHTRTCIYSTHSSTEQWNTAGNMYTYSQGKGTAAKQSAYNGRSMFVDPGHETVHI